MTLKDTKPIRGYLLIEPEQSEVEKKASISGLAIPDTVTKYDVPQVGTVLKVGGDLLTDQGAVIPSPVRSGDKVIYKKWGGNEVKLDDKDYYFVRFDDILGLC